MTRVTKEGFGVVCSLILILLFAMADTRARAEDGKDGPVMVIPESVFDFKEVKEGTLLEYSFKVYNKGKGVLTIKRIWPG